MKLVQRDLLEIRVGLGLAAESPGQRHITGWWSKAGPS